MEVIAFQGKAFHLGFGDFNSSGVLLLIKARLDAQALLSSGASNELDNRLKAGQWAAPPVLRDVTEEAVFDLVPLARSRWEVADANAQSRFVGKLLDCDLPG